MKPWLQWFISVLLLSRASGNIVTLERLQGETAVRGSEKLRNAWSEAGVWTCPSSLLCTVTHREIWLLQWDGRRKLIMQWCFSTGSLLTKSSKRAWGEGCIYSCWNETWDVLLWGVTGFITHGKLVWSVGAFVLELNLCVSPGEELLLPSTGRWGLTSEMVNWSRVLITNEVLP